MFGISLEEKGSLQLLVALEALKKSGYKHQDAMEIWCSDWATASADSDMRTGAKVQIAKRELQKLKSIKKALATATQPLDETIERVTEQSSDIIRIAGFSSLPDDVLARIFEMNHQAYRENLETCGAILVKRFHFVCTSNVLAQVCRRFRRIALHIPSLWDIVSNTHKKDWITGVRQRCRDPAVFVVYHVKGANKMVSDLLQLTHPANRWKTLDVRFNCQKNSHDFIKLISAVSDGRLSSLQKLSLRLDWDRFIDLEDDSVNEDEDDVEEHDASTNLSEPDSSLLSTWNLPQVSELTLANLIPSNLNCPTLRTCHIELCGLQETKYWSLNALKNFLSCLPLVCDLSFSFVNACSSTEPDPSNLKPVEFPYLKTLGLKVEASTEEKLVRGVLDMANVSTVTDLSVSISPFSFYDSISPKNKVEEWISVIFFLDPMRRRIRSFVNVEVFCFSLQADAGYISYEGMFRALPRVRDVTIKLPGCGEPNLSYQCLNDLRTLRLKKCTSYCRDGTSRFLKERIKSGKIEEVEIEGCHSLRRNKGDLQKLLGDNFVWKESE